MHIGFTGTQAGMNDYQRRVLEDTFFSLFRAHHELVLHHGDCIGSDAQAHAIFHDLAVDLVAPASIVIHPPNKREKRAYMNTPWGGHENLIPVQVLPERDYIPRNEDIVERSEILIATPEQESEVLRSGTWTTIRRARDKNIGQHIIYPTGVHLVPQS